MTILDVATGSADIPVALLRWGRRHNVKLHATGVDLSPDVLAEASRFVGREPVELVLADARALPWPDRSFDLVTCSLALHHFDPQAAEEAVREMVRLARRAVIITDLRRSYVSYTATWLVTRIVARNRLTKHDGPLSVLRAYTPHELRTIAEAAGASPAHIRRHRFFRQVLVYRPEQPHA